MVPHRRSVCTPDFTQVPRLLNGNRTVASTSQQTLVMGWLIIGVGHAGPPHARMRGCGGCSILGTAQVRGAARHHLRRTPGGHRHGDPSSRFPGQAWHRARSAGHPPRQAHRQRRCQRAACAYAAGERDLTDGRRDTASGSDVEHVCRHGQCWCALLGIWSTSTLALLSCAHNVQSMSCILLQYAAVCFDASLPCCASACARVLELF